MSTGVGHSSAGLGVPNTNGHGRKVSLQEAVQTDSRQREVSGGSVSQTDIMGSNSSLQVLDTQQLLVEKIVKLQKACARRQVII